MAFVVDASVALAWVLPDEKTPAARALLDRAVASDAIAASIWPIELASALLTAQRRKRISAADRAALLERLARLPVAVIPAPSFHALQGIAQLAHEQQLSVYDACYLHLAQEHRLPLATLDIDLRSAATRAGVETLPDLA